MKAKTELKEFRSLGEDELKEKVIEAEAELMNLRFKHASAQLEQTAQLTSIRRRIARMKTVQNERQANEQGGSVETNQA